MKDRDKTLYGAVKDSAKSFPENIALLYMGAKIDYKTLLGDIDALAGYFSGKGIKAGDAVTLCMPNIPQCVVCFYALSKIGAVAHLVHPLAPEQQLRTYIESVGSKMLVVPDIMAKSHERIIADGFPTLLCSPAYYLGFVRKTLFSLKSMSALSGLKKYDNVDFYSVAVKCAPPNAPDFSEPEVTAVYLHSGGTSGTPKTIALSSRAVNALTDNSFDILGIKSFSGGCMLAVLPMFHGFGLAMGIHAMLCYGGTDTLMPKFHTLDTLKLIEQNKINYLIGVPVLYEALLRRKEFSGAMLKNLRQAFVGGDYVPKRLLEDFNKRMEENGSDCRLYEGYGLTETVTVCSVNTTYACREGSVGRAVGGIDIRAFSENLEPLKPGEEGELCIAGDELMNEYLNDPEGTEAVFFEYGGRKYVKSGDVGYVDEDGYVFFRSRIKRIAKVSGVTVFPSEIEKLAMDELDEVKEACAIADKDERSGDGIALFIVPENGRLSDEEKDALRVSVSDFIENRLSVYARPKKVFFVTELPKTLIGKVDFNKLKDIYL